MVSAGSETSASEIASLPGFILIIVLVVSTRNLYCEL